MNNVDLTNILKNPTSSNTFHLAVALKLFLCVYRVSLDVLNEKLMDLYNVLTFTLFNVLIYYSSCLFKRKLSELERFKTVVR